MTTNKQDESRRLILHSPNIVNLCIDSYNMEQQYGRLYHQYTKQSILFFSLFEALDKMEQLYDVLQFPQAATQIRSFLVDRRAVEQKIRESKGSIELPNHIKEDIEKVESFDKVVEQRGRDATFVVRVKFRQHSSWQGEVTWVDGQKKEYFRSALELVKLMDSALHAQDS